jgi:hypothetical protein
MNVIVLYVVNMEAKTQIENIDGNIENQYWPDEIYYHELHGYFAIRRNVLDEYFISSLKPIYNHRKDWEYEGFEPISFYNFLELIRDERTIHFTRKFGA